MKKLHTCNFESIEDKFNFGRYCGLSLADVLDINPSYINWCVKHCTGVIFQLSDNVIEDIKVVYPLFLMDALFESKRKWNLCRNNCDESFSEIYYDDSDEDEYAVDYFDAPTYERYSGFWAQDIEGYSDDDIETIFDGDPSAYWNID